MTAQVEANRKPFTDSTTYFEGLVTQLQTEGFGQMPHEQIEEHLRVEGQELMRRLFQDHLDLRAVREPRLRSVKGADGQERTHHRQGQVFDLETLFGEVQPQRRTYEGKGIPRICPADAQLNRPQSKYSYGLQKKICTEAAQGAFDQTLHNIDTTTRGHVPKRQAEQIVQDAAVDFDPFYQTRKAQKPSDQATILVTSFDGKGVVVRPQDLREQTKKKAQKAKPKLQTRLSPGEKKNRKRMACVAAVYSLAPFVREPEDILKKLRPVQPVLQAKKRPKPEHKRVWASLKKPPEAVMAQAFEEAQARDPEQRLSWVTLVDGNDDQIRLALAYQDLSGIEMTIIVDVIHVSEYLWKAAFALCGRSSPKAEAWMQERLLRVLRGEASAVAGGMRRAATKRGLSASRRKAVDACAKYLLKYKAFLRYDQYLASGFPIATGVIEGACRHLVKDRMDVPGRWSLEGAEAVLQLRALQCSGDFEAYWQYHVQAEYQRNHGSRYANQTPPNPWAQKKQNKISALSLVNSH